VGAPRSVRLLPLLVHALALLALLSDASRSYGRSLKQVLTNPGFEDLELAALAPVLADTVASTYPVASASSSVTWEFDPASGSWQSRRGLTGPLIGERAETIGRGRFNVGLTFSYVHPTQIDGDDLDSLVNKKLVDGNFISINTGPRTLVDGRFTNFLPALVNLDLDLDAYLTTPQITYGVTPNLDVSLTLPLVYTRLIASTVSELPDPRFPSFFCCQEGPEPSQTVSQGESAFGVGDMLLRGKYVVLRNETADVAGSLGLSFPTGEEDDFHGRGDMLVQPLFVASRKIGARFEPLFNAGISLNANDVDRSVAQWAVGTTVGLMERLTGTLVFLGRHEFSRQSDKIEQPFFFQIERNDYYDVSVGLRVRFAENGVISGNAIMPLNDDGLRAEVIPTGQIEYAF
jgi:hypothetical protein